MSILKAASVVGAFLTWMAVEMLFLRLWPTCRLLRIVAGNVFSVTQLCLAWHGFSLTAFSEIIFLSTMGITFRSTIEYVNQSYGGKKGLALGLLAGHLAAVGVALVWYLLVLLYLVIFN